jgi:phosphate transport system substrate-binding protein
MINFVGPHHSSIGVMGMGKTSLFSALTAILILGLAGCGSLSGRMVQIKGSDTMVNLVQILAESFMESDPGNAVAVLGGGSGTGITGLINGTCDIAGHSREIKPAEYAMLEEKGIAVRTFIMAVDGLSLICHDSNPVGELTLDQIGAVFRGNIRNWEELGGPDRAISLYGRQSNSGTYVYFQDHILGKQDFSPHMKEMNGNAQIIEGVAGDRAAIGYVGIGYIRDADTGGIRPGIKALRVSKGGGEASLSPLESGAVQSGEYPIARPLYLSTGGPPSATAASFLRFVNSPEGQSIIRREGFFPVKPEILRENLEKLKE